MQGDVRLFEIGSVFTPRPDALPYEELRVGALIMGRRQPAHFTDPKSPEFDAWVTYSEWDAKTLAQTVAEAVYPSAAVAMRDAESPTALWDVLADEQVVGIVRGVTLDAPVWARPAFGVEIRLSDRPAQVALCESAYRHGRFSAMVLLSSPADHAGRGIRSRAVGSRPFCGEQIEAVMRRVSGKLRTRRVSDRYGEGSPVIAASLRRPPARGAHSTGQRDRARCRHTRALSDELNVRHRTN
jgi:hypothetical protein